VHVVTNQQERARRSESLDARQINEIMNDIKSGDVIFTCFLKIIELQVSGYVSVSPPGSRHVVGWWLCQPQGPEVR